MEPTEQLGTIFANRFLLESVLGTGGMGAVYLARHTVMQRQVAIKVIHSAMVSNQEVVARFRQEARVAARLNHPQITAVYDFGITERGQPYLVMEYVPGTQLSDLVDQRDPLPVPVAVDILLQLAQGLHAAHVCQVIHRDLKPQNIVVTSPTPNGLSVKILDFGLAKIVGPETLGLTAQGSIFGTPSYMAPEQCSGGPPDPRSDSWCTRPGPANKGPLK